MTKYDDISLNRNLTRAALASLSLLAAVACAITGRAQSTVVRFDQTLPVKDMPDVRGVYNPATGKYRPVELDASLGWVVVAEDFAQYRTLLAERKRAQEAATRAEEAAAQAETAAPPAQEAVAYPSQPVWPTRMAPVVGRIAQGGNLATHKSVIPVASPSCKKSAGGCCRVCPCPPHPQCRRGGCVGPCPKPSGCPLRGRR